MSTTEFALRCPHCGKDNDDPLEIFEEGKLDWTRCFHCEQAFHFFIGSCEQRGCFTDTSFTWKEQPSPSDVAALVCSACRQPFLSATAEEDDLY